MAFGEGASSAVGEGGLKASSSASTEKVASVPPCPWELSAFEAALCPLDCGNLRGLRVVRRRMFGFSRVLAWASALALPVKLLSPVEGQIRVQSPKSLQESLRSIGATSPDTQDVLVGSTAAFGTPVYGTVLR